MAMIKQTDYQQFKIRDLRQKEKFVVDDEYLNGYARLCGWQASLVYLSLCRHAPKEQKSFPSARLMSEELDVSTHTIFKGIKNLQEWNVVKVKNTYRKDGGKSSNIYILLDKSAWKPKPTPYISGNDIPHISVEDIPYRQEQSTPISDSDKKDTQYKETHIKEKELNKSKSLSLPLGEYPSLTSLGEAEFQQIAEDYQVPIAFVRSKYDDLINYVPNRTRKPYRNYMVALRSFVKQDAIKIGKEEHNHVSKRGIDARHIQ